MLGLFGMEPIFGESEEGDPGAELDVDTDTALERLEVVDVEEWKDRCSHSSPTTGICNLAKKNPPNASPFPHNQGVTCKIYLATRDNSPTARYNRKTKSNPPRIQPLPRVKKTRIYLA